MPWRSLIAWLLVLPVAGWFVLRAPARDRCARQRSSRGAGRAGAAPGV